MAPPDGLGGAESKHRDGLEWYAEAIVMTASDHGRAS